MTIRVPGTFTLVHLLANTIMNVTTQEDQLAVFANAAAHAESGGCFVVQVIVPHLQHVPPWPSEPELMGVIAGFGLRDHRPNWRRAPFTSASASQAAIFETT